MNKPSLARRAYDWVLHWSETKYGMPALFLIAFIESSFFPIPPDVLLIALAFGAPTKAFRFALACTIGSMLGGMFGYFIGMAFFDVIGIRILEFYGFLDKFYMIKDLYDKYDIWIVAIAGFTPIPYKVFTIASGVFGMNFPEFVIVSFFSRGARFYIVAALIWKFGPPIKKFIDTYFNMLSIAFIIILVLGFVIVKMLF
jgi:membrane protein YqaA with SNARE-associated domain